MRRRSSRDRKRPDLTDSSSRSGTKPRSRPATGNRSYGQSSPRDTPESRSRTPAAASTQSRSPTGVASAGRRRRPPGRGRASRSRPGTPDTTDVLPIPALPLTSATRGPDRPAPSPARRRGRPAPTPRSGSGIAVPYAPVIQLGTSDRSPADHGIAFGVRRGWGGRRWASEQLRTDYGETLHSRSMSRRGSTTAGAGIAPN